MVGDDEGDERFNEEADDGDHETRQGFIPRWCSAPELLFWPPRHLWRSRQR
jgi:hypothetical protein